MPFIISDISSNLTLSGGVTIESGTEAPSSMSLLRVVIFASPISATSFTGKFFKSFASQ